MIFLQMIYMYQDIQDTAQEKCATNVHHRSILRETVNGHFHAMIAERHIRLDQHYVDTVQTADQGVCQLIEEEAVLREEIDPKIEEEETIISSKEIFQLQEEDIEEITEEKGKF